jgi:outer membrane protein assembly factor BamA
MNVDNDKKNFYTKIAYQFGTQFDERLNAIVGETRGRQTPVLTAFRDIGPQRTGYAVAMTQTFNVAGGDFNDATGEMDYAVGDYKYTKLEAEGLRRFDITNTSFIFSRLHMGAFIGYDDIPNREDRFEIERYSVPRYEMFRLGGREALRAVDEDEFTIGTHELHVTNEYFRPIFRNRDYKMGVVHWNTLYGIAYLGAGSVGLEASQIFESDRFVADAGLGAEAALTIRDFEVLISFVVAQTFRAPDEIEGRNFRFSIRTIR